ncbi:MAG: DUF2569 family protein [Candidatus Thiodiazotropha lotti]|nr:DUF2569 family protein [Candidatus Thiodiazotropha lotti]MCW4220736.1 DUF2569 family protein [Candidatus Thiodiazotropha lotti]
MESYSTKFRLFLFLSIAWFVIVILAVSVNDKSYWDIPDYAIRILIFTSPVWIFWSITWIWPSIFNSFFTHKSNSKDLKKWIYVEESVAQTHEYYGISGWAFLIVLGLLLSPAKILIEFYAEDIIVSDFAHINGIVALYRIEEITNWLLACFCLLTLYYLIKHKPEFQKLYLILMLSFILLPIVDTFAVISVFKNADINLTVDDLYTSQEISRQIAASITSLFWIIYVYKSKRINITTRKRLKRKHMQMLKSRVKVA